MQGWVGNPYFGIADGFVSTFAIIAVPLEAGSIFHLALPHFSKDAVTDSYEATRPDAKLSFVVRDAKTWNILGRLVPPDAAMRLVPNGKKRKSNFEKNQSCNREMQEAAYRLGYALLQEGKMKEAADELRHSDRLRPDMPETLYSLGRATAVSDPSAAEHAFLRVIELEKQTRLAGQACLALAGIHRKQDKTDQAAHDMQEYRRIQALTAGPPG